MKPPVKLNTFDRSLFDYAAMDISAVHTVEQAADRIRDCQRAAIVDIGRELNTIKEALSHGQFIPWLKAEFGWSHGTALNYMRVADTIGDKFATVAHLPATVLYKLASPSTPLEVRDQVLKVEAGKTVDPRDVVEFIDKTKARQKAEHERQKAAPDRSPKGLAKAKQKERREARADERRYAEHRAKVEAGKIIAKDAAQAIRDALGDRLGEIIAAMKGQPYQVQDTFTEALFRPMSSDASK